MTAGAIEKNVVCSSCDGFCPVSAKVVDGQVVKVAARKDPFLKDVICMKGAYAPKSFAHPDRLMVPLQRVGERGAGQWRQVSWEEALDDIASKLSATIDRHGPEAFAVATSNWNTTVDSGMSRRFMNLLGSPNWISGVAYCMGNTAAVNRMVYGWYPRGDVLHSKCIVLFGHNPRRHSWTAEFKAIRVAQANGAKLIVLDPRESENAEVADLWLPLKAGTDAAMCFGWLNVILDEGLYDPDFVERFTTGFDAFVERVREYPLERVAAITGVDAELIAKAARMYATNAPASIPWSPITDQQTSSTSAIRLHCALRALTGNLDVKGGERFMPFNPGIVSDTDLELHERLAPEQRAKQLGADEFPVFTYRGMEALREPTRRTWGTRVGEPGRWLLHGQPHLHVPGDGGGQAVPGQGVLLAREQHADGVRQHAPDLQGPDEPGPLRGARAHDDAHGADRRLRAAGGRLARASEHDGGRERTGRRAAGRVPKRLLHLARTGPSDGPRPSTSPGSRSRTCSTIAWPLRARPGKTLSPTGRSP